MFPGNPFYLELVVYFIAACTCESIVLDFVSSGETLVASS